MKNILVIIGLVLVSNMAFAQTEKTLVKTFNLQGSTAVVLDLDGEVVIREWGEKTMRVHMNIQLQNTNVHMLKHLMTKGRYNLNIDNSGSASVVTSPGRNQDVIINKQGDTLKENVSYIVFIPAKIRVETLDSNVNAEVAGEK
jgi:hypothetical protein